MDMSAGRLVSDSSGGESFGFEEFSLIQSKDVLQNYCLVAVSRRAFGSPTLPGPPPPLQGLNMSSRKASAVHECRLVAHAIT